MELHTCPVCQQPKPPTEYRSVDAGRGRQCRVCRATKRSRANKKKRLDKESVGLAMLAAHRTRGDALLCVVCRVFKPRDAFNAAALRFTGPSRARCRICNTVVGAYKEDLRRSQTIITQAEAVS